MTDSMRIDRGTETAVPPSAPEFPAGASVETILEALPLRRGQIWLVAIVLAALMFDGLQIQLLSFVAPVILNEWTIDKAALGPAMAAALIGMTVGASVGGWLGDRIGATRMLIASVLFFGLTTLVTGLAWDLTSLFAIRFISGLGLGAAGPSGIALVADWLPSRARGKAIALLSIGAPLGGAVGAAAVASVLPLWGWRGSFVASGVVTIVLAMAMIPLLPESWSFLIREGRVERAQRALLRLLGHDFAPAQLQARERQGGGARSRAIPTGYGRLAIGTGVAYFCVQFVSFAFLAWAPVVLTSKAFTMPQALTASFTMNSVGVAAALIAPFLLDRFGSRGLLRSVHLALAATVALLGVLLFAVAQTPDAGKVLAVQAGMALLGGLIAISITALWTVMASGYPAGYRSTGLGLGMMMGRVGCVVILLIGGLLINIDPRHLSAFFISLMLLSLGALAAAEWIDRHVARARPRG